MLVSHSGFNQCDILKVGTNAPTRHRLLSSSVLPQAVFYASGMKATVTAALVEKVAALSHLQQPREREVD